MNLLNLGSIISCSRKLRCVASLRILLNLLNKYLILLGVFLSFSVPTMMDRFRNNANTRSRYLDELIALFVIRLVPGYVFVALGDEVLDNLRLQLRSDTLIGQCRGAHS